MEKEMEKENSERKESQEIDMDKEIQ